MEFLVSNMEFLVDPENVLKDYFRSRLILLLIIWFNLTCEILLTFWVLKNEESILEHLFHIYKFVRQNDFRIFFEGASVTSLGLNLLLYIYSSYAVYSHSVTKFQTFLILLMISVYGGILLTYVNV
jgi:hypothetical protein